MPNRTIDLTDDLDRFVEDGISSGRYSDASEMVRSALGLLVEQDKEYALKLEQLREAARLGFDAYERGEYVELNSPEEIDELMTRLGEEAGQLVRSRAESE